MAKFVLTAQLALQAPTNTRQVISQIRRQLQGINVNVNLQANTSQLNNVNAQLNQTTKSARAAEKSISDLGRSLGAAARRFGIIAIATGTFLNLSRAIKSSLGDAIEFERELVNLSQVTGKSIKNLQDITGEVTRLSTGLGVSSDQLLKTSVVLAQAGLEARKVKSALEVLAKTELASSFDNITNTTEGAIAILSQFRKEAAAAGGDTIYLERALGAINDVSKKFAVESADLVAVIRRSGGAFEAAGGSLNELLALFTSVRATTRESAETIATGLRTIFTRIQRVDTIAQLQELGIVLQDVEGKFVGPFEAIKRISEGLAGLDPRDFRFSAIVEELGGYRQIGKVIPLIKQFTVAQDALNTAQAASGSLTKDAETAQLSLANQLAKVREEFQALIREFVDSSAFRSVAGGALEFARALIRIADALEPVLPLIGSLVAIQVGKGLIPALGSFTGLTRRNAGGPIHKFASGGFVPGSGNRDTVPAMLTPGEFVIRKSSVNKIGAERLQKLNSGGQVWDQNAFAALTLEDFQNKKTFQASDPFTEEVKKLAKSRNIKLKNSYPVDIFGIDQEKFSGSDLKNDFAKGAQIAINSIADKFKKAGIKTTVPVIPDNVLNKFKNSIGQGTIGSLFEAAISAIKDPNFTDATDQQRPFDFIGGVGGAEKLFAGFNNATYKYADAKVSESAARGKSSSGFNSKINRQAKRELSGLQGKEAADSKDLKKAFDEYSKQNAGPLSRIKINKFIEQQGGKEQKTNEKVQDWLRDRGIFGKFEPVNPEKPASGYNFIYKNLGGKIQKFAKGGKPKTPKGHFRTPLIDDLKNTPDAIMPNPDIAMKSIKASGYGALDLDRTLFRTIGDLAYAKAKTPEQKTEVLRRYFQDTQARLRDVKTAKMTQFGVALKEAIKNKEVDPNKLSIISKSGRTPGLAEYVNEVFGIPVSNTVFTSGGDKGKPLDAIRIKGPRNERARKFAKGGAASDTVPAMLTPGEFVVNKKTAQRVGYANLHRMNKTGQVQGFAKGGPVGVQRFAQGGGPVTPISPTKAGVSSSGNPNQKAQIQDFINLVKSLTVAANGTKSSFEIVSNATKQLISQYGTLESGTKKVIKVNAQNAKAVEKAEKQELAKYNAQQKQIEGINQFTSSLSKTLSSAQNFVFLGSSVAALTTQFSSMDQATNDAITETLGVAVSMVGLIGTVGELVLNTRIADKALQYFSGSVTKAAATSSAGGAGGAAGAVGMFAKLAGLLANPAGAVVAVIAVVVAALAGFAAYIYFIQARAKKVAEGLRKSADEIAASIEQGKGGDIQEYVNLQVQAAKTITDSYLTLNGTLDALGITSAQARQEEIDAIKRVSSAYITTVDTIAKADKQLASIDLDKSLTPAEAAFKKIGVIAQEGANLRSNLQASPTSEIQKLAQREKVFKPTSQLTEADFSSANAKATFQLLEKNLTATFDSLEKRSAELQALAQAQLEGALQTTDFTQAATKDLNADGLIDSFDTVLTQNQDFALAFNQVSQSIIASSKAMADELRKSGQFVKASQVEEIANKQAKTLAESAQKQAVAFQKSQAGAIAFQQALEANLAEFRALKGTAQFLQSLNNKLNDFGTRVSDLNNIMSGELMSFEIPEIQGLSNLSDIKDFDKFKTDVSALGASIGPEGERLAQKLVDSAALMENAKKELIGINFAKIGKDAENSAKFAFEKAFGKSGQKLQAIFGGDVGGQLGATIQKQLEDSIRTASERGGMVDPASELQKILEPLQEVIEENRALFETLNNTQREYINQYDSTSKSLFEVIKRDIDGRQKLVDIQNRGLSRLDQATNRSVSFQEKEARRNSSRGARLGAVGLGALTGDIRGMGSVLSIVNQELQDNAERIKKNNTDTNLRKAQSDLTLKANELKKSLEELADQSDKASDVMTEIDKERGKRETVSKIVESFVVGGEQDRAGINQQFMGLQAAMMAGSLQVLPEEDRKASFGLLEQLASVNDNFKAVKESLIASDAMRMGLSPEIAMQLATATPKEQQLLQELQQITRDEIAAQQELNRINADFGSKLSTELNDLSAQINSLSAAIEKTFNQKFVEATARQTQEGAAQASATAEAADKDKASVKVKGIETRLKQAQENRGGAIQTNIELAKELNFKQKEVESSSKMSENKTWGDAFQNVVSLGGALFTTSQQERFNQASANANQTANEIANKNKQISDMDVEIARLQQELALAQSEQQQTEAKYQAETVLPKAKGGLIYRANGGSIFKPKGTDTIPAMLTPGEFVMQKSAVDKYGVSTMQAMNQGVAYLNGGGLSAEDLYTYRNRNKITDRSQIQEGMDKFTGGNYDVGNFNAADLYNDLAERNNELSKQERDKMSQRLIDSYKTPAQKPTKFAEPAYITERYAKQDREAKASAQSRRESSVKSVRESQRQEDKKSGLIKTFQPNVNAPKYKTSSERRQQRIDRLQSQRDAVQRMQNRGMPYTASDFVAGGIQERQQKQSQSFFDRQQNQYNTFLKNQGMAPMATNAGPVAGGMAQAMAGSLAGSQMAGNGQQQGFNVEPLVKLQQTFDNLAAVLGNMQMTHQVNVDGALNINGVNTVEVATAIQQAIGKFITTEVERIVNNKGFRTP